MDILFVSANSADEYIDIEREHRTLQKLVETGGHSLRVLPAAQFSDLRDALSANGQDRASDILHFSGHVTEEEGLQLRGTGRRKDFVSGTRLKRILKGSGIRLVVLNACHSEALAVALSKVVPVVIGTTRAIPDLVARRFTHDFYSALMGHGSVSLAFDAALGKQRPSSSPAYVRVGENQEPRLT